MHLLQATVLLVYSDFLSDLQLLLESHQAVNWDSGKVTRKKFLLAFCLKQNQNKRILGIFKKKKNIKEEKLSKTWSSGKVQAII